MTFTILSNVPEEMYEGLDYSPSKNQNPYSWRTKSVSEIKHIVDRQSRR